MLSMDAVVDYAMIGWFGHQASRMRSQPLRQGWTVAIDTGFLISTVVIWIFLLLFQIISYVDINWHTQLSK